MYVERREIEGNKQGIEREIAPHTPRHKTQELQKLLIKYA